jgi:hypothetical protein
LIFDFFVCFEYRVRSERRARHVAQCSAQTAGRPDARAILRLPRCGSVASCPKGSIVRQRLNLIQNNSDLSQGLPVGLRQDAGEANRPHGLSCDREAGRPCSMRRREFITLHGGAT